MLTKSVFLLLLLVSVSCGTMRLQVRSPYRSAQGSGTMIFEKSYDVGGGMPLWCGLTAILYGGACWAYLGMPFVPQENKIIKDATDQANTSLGTTDVVLENPQVKRLSWSSAEPYVEMNSGSERVQ